MIYLSMLKNLVRSRMLRVAVIGGFGLLLQTVIFEILGIYWGLVPASTAAVLGGEVAILSNFFLNERFSFRDRRDPNSPLLWRITRFHAVVAGSIFIQWLFIFMTERATGDLLLIHAAYIAGVGVGFFLNYAGYYFFVWTAKNSPNVETM